MKKLIFVLCVLAFVGCDRDDNKNLISVETMVESFEGDIEGDYAYGFR